jgi:hypothetical protein
VIAGAVQMIVRQARGNGRPLIGSDALRFATGGDVLRPLRPRERHKKAGRAVEMKAAPRLSPKLEGKLELSAPPGAKADKADKEQQASQQRD